MQKKSTDETRNFKAYINSNFNSNENPCNFANVHSNLEVKNLSL